MPKIDPDLFNTDPKFEKDREDFDKLFAGAVKRAIDKKQKETPADENVFDTLFGGLFSSSKKEGE